ncbi:MAG: DUF2158 domain-containing protein [Beijerinckiaceae bacterium]|jgi:uncharacterized protein YodC (DUF2158 family)|nr:DUF2158 domain-containing protein [Beijerinckiaceae bacterium]
MTFSEGDIVNVKSGGPALTVLSVASGQVTCLFYSEELGEFKQAVIPSFALEAYDDEAEDEDDDHTSSNDDEEEDEDNEDDKAA